MNHLNHWWGVLQRQWLSEIYLESFGINNCKWIFVVQIVWYWKSLEGCSSFSKMIRVNNSLVYVYGNCTEHSLINLWLFDGPAIVLIIYNLITASCWVFIPTQLFTKYLPKDSYQIPKTFHRIGKWTWVDLSNLSGNTWLMAESGFDPALSSVRGYLLNHAEIPLFLWNIFYQSMSLHEIRHDKKAPFNLPMTKPCIVCQGLNVSRFISFIVDDSNVGLCLQTIIVKITKGEILNTDQE